MTKEYLQRRAARLARKSAKRKLKATAMRIAKQQKKHEENVRRRKEQAERRKLLENGMRG